MTGNPRPAVSAIVLAGGRSSRFGRDKLRATLEGRSLLERAVEAVAGVATDIVVVTEPGAPPRLPAGEAQARLVADENAFEGPLAGCLTGLLAAREPYALVVGGDMPTLQPAVLHLLVRALETSQADAAALEHLGTPRPLPLALRTGAGTDAARRLLADRERRLRALLEHLAIRSIPETEWRALDPRAVTLLDVDEPGDLERFEPPI